MKIDVDSKTLKGQTFLVGKKGGRYRGKGKKESRETLTLEVRKHIRAVGR